MYLLLYIYIYIYIYMNKEEKEDSEAIYELLNKFLDYIISDDFINTKISYYFNLLQDDSNQEEIFIKNQDDELKRIFKSFPKMKNLHREILLKKCVFTTYAIWSGISKIIFRKTDKEINKDNYEFNRKKKNQKKEFLYHLSNSEPYTFYRINLGNNHTFCLIKVSETHLIIIDSYFTVRKTEKRLIKIDKFINVIKTNVYDGEEPKNYIKVFSNRAISEFDNIFNANNVYKDNIEKAYRNGIIREKNYLNYTSQTISPDSLKEKILSEEIYTTSPVKNSDLEKDKEETALEKWIKKIEIFKNESIIDEKEEKLLEKLIKKIKRFKKDIDEEEEQWKIDIKSHRLVKLIKRVKEKINSLSMKEEKSNKAIAGFLKRKKQKTKKQKNKKKIRIK